MRDIRRRVLVVFWCLALWPVSASGQGTPWASYTDGGIKAFQQGKHAEAEKFFQAAVKEAEQFGPQDSRLPQSLNNLAALYYKQGQYARAEPVYKRSLGTREKALGPEHPDVAQSLQSYAALLRKTNRATEASGMEARAQAIRAKQSKKNPAK